MKKVILILLVITVFFAACTAPETEYVADGVQPVQTTEEMKETEPEPTEAPTPEPTPEPTPTPEPLSKQIAVVIARDGYASAEFNPVMDALVNAGYEPIVVSDALGTANGFGEIAEVEMTFADINTADLGGIVLIGGSTMLWDNAELHAILNEMNTDGKLVAAICYASVIHAEGGIIGEGDTACWFNSPESDPKMEAKGVVDSAQNVTVMVIL